jgi:hypothetical protein
MMALQVLLEQELLDEEKVQDLIKMFGTDFDELQ